MSELVVQDVSKSYGKGITRNIVLERVNLEVSKGEFVSLLGPSGCGKTTLLNIIAVFLPADSGSVAIEGRRIEGPGSDRGFVFQSFALFPWMTVRNNILYPMKRQGLPHQQQKERLQELLEMAHLVGKDQLYPHQLSGGMKQRTAMVRALACQPKVLLMDEPLAALDYQMRISLQQQLEEIVCADGATVVMVTHDVDEAIYMSDRVVVMSQNQGRIMDDLPIKLPRQRDRNHPLYQEYMSRLRSQLKIEHLGWQTHYGSEEVISSQYKGLM